MPNCQKSVERKKKKEYEEQEPKQANSVQKGTKKLNLHIKS